MQGNIHHRTSGTIEAWNYILKEVDHRTHRKRPDAFIQEHYPILVGRQLQYIDTLTSKKQKSVIKASHKHLMLLLNIPQLNQLKLFAI